LSRRYGSDAAGRSWPLPGSLLERAPWVLGSTDDSKAHSGDGDGDFGGESFERPMFSGVRRSKLARERSWRRARSGRQQRERRGRAGTATPRRPDGRGSRPGPPDRPATWMGRTGKVSWREAGRDRRSGAWPPGGKLDADGRGRTLEAQQMGESAGHKAGANREAGVGGRLAGGAGRAKLLFGGGWPAAPAGAALSKNSNCGWDFLERMGCYGVGTGGRHR